MILFDVFLCLFCFSVSIAVFRVSVALPCTLITPISKLHPLENLSAILEYVFALQQQEKFKKMCHFMFPVETFVHAG